MVEPNPACLGCPPEDPPSEVVTDPKKVFESFFLSDCSPWWKREQIEKLYADVMAHKMGLELFFKGWFWMPQVFEQDMMNFHEFVLVYKIPIKVTWRESSRSGFSFWGAELKDCQPLPD